MPDFTQTPFRFPVQKISQSDPQLAFWRDLALWLADVTVATAIGTLELKSSSKTEKRRQKEIITTTLQMLETRQFLGRSRSGESSVVQRLKNVTVTDRGETK